ncbi:MAG: cation-translocating P-type ATPase [Candidatus Fermentibacteraceae bacterium]|nr:cation-translocating P-type ATPase [Candidatus Fermentibacteraceae bacterium]
MEYTDFYKLTPGEALKKLGSSMSGLPREAAEAWRREHGSNEIIVEKPVPKWLVFLSQFKELLVIVLIVAGVISIAVGSYQDGAVMFIIVLVNAVIGFVQEYKAGKILEKLKALIQSPAKVIVKGQLVELPQADLVPGDIVSVEAGDKIPADIRLLEAYNLRTNDFSLTGESMPQDKNNEAMDGDAILADRHNMAYTGTTVASGSATGLVVRTGRNTEMGKIASMASGTVTAMSPLQMELNNLAKWLTAIVVFLSAVLFFVGVQQGFTVFNSLIYALGIAVASVPQALPAQVTVALSAASKRLAERRVVVKSLPSVETLGSTSVICTDKTGTLTKNEMTVTGLWFNGEVFDVQGLGYKPEGSIHHGDGTKLSEAEIDEMEIMLDAGTMASNAEIHEPDKDHNSWYPVGDPTEAALITLSTKVGTRSPNEDTENPEIIEFPFDSERKRMSSVRQFGSSYQLAMKGATASVLSISRYIYRNGKSVPITDADREEITRLNEEYSDRALRVLAIAFRPLEKDGSDYTMETAEKDVVFLGLVFMMDPPKEGVKEAIAVCHEARIRVIIMTGDHAITARAIGREIGLSKDGDPLVYTGVDLEKMDDDELGEILAGGRAIVFSRVNPAHKLRIVTILEDQGEVVAVTGDGVNDAPALKKANIGVAMGITGTDVSKEAAELILLDDSFTSLVYAVEEGRTIYTNLKKTVLATMTTNAAELGVVILGLIAVSMGDWAIPILAIQILAIDLLAEVLPLTFLTFDPSSKSIMQEAPRDLKAHIMNKETSMEVLLLGALIGLLAFGNYAYSGIREGMTFFSGEATGSVDYMRATTLAYLTIAFCQFANVLSRRFYYTSIFNRNVFTNRILLWSIMGSAGMILLFVNIPVLSRFLYFSPLGFNDWMCIAGSTSVFLLVFELLKVGRRFKRARQK